jgi:hypothetical protein
VPLYRDTLFTLRDLCKLLIECQQEIPECIESFKPEVQSDRPLFEDDNDDDDDDDATSAPFNAAPVSQGASWDAGDNSVDFQGNALRIDP